MPRWTYYSYSIILMVEPNFDSLSPQKKKKKIIKCENNWACSPYITNKMKGKL